MMKYNKNRSFGENSSKLKVLLDNEISGSSGKVIWAKVTSTDQDKNTNWGIWITGQKMWKVGG